MFDNVYNARNYNMILEMKTFKIKIINIILQNIGTHMHYTIY